MDWMLVWTALSAIVTAAGFIIPLFVGIRRNDKAELKEKHSAINERIDVISRTLNAKLDKDEFIRFVDRIDKEFEQLRAEKISGNERLYQEIRSSRTELLEEIRSLRDRK